MNAMQAADRAALSAIGNSDPEAVMADANSEPLVTRRFASFCRVHGTTPATLRAQPTRSWSPDFIAWVRSEKEKFLGDVNAHIQDQAAFDDYLETL